MSSKHESKTHGAVSQADFLSLTRLRRDSITTRDYVFSKMGLDIKKDPVGAPVAFYFALNQINFRIKRFGEEIMKEREGTPERAYGDEVYVLRIKRRVKC